MKAQLTPEFLKQLQNNVSLPPPIAWILILRQKKTSFSKKSLSKEVRFGFLKKRRKYSDSKRLAKDYIMGPRFYSKLDRIDEVLLTSQIESIIFIVLFSAIHISLIYLCFFFNFITKKTYIQSIKPPIINRPLY